MSLDGLSLSCLVKELDEKLKGSRIEKIFQPNNTSLFLRLRNQGENLILNISTDPANLRINLTDSLPENPFSPPNFCMLLRKHFEGGRIAQIDQCELDRIVTVSVDTIGKLHQITTKKLIIELTGKHSNIIFVEDDTIVDSLKRINAYMSRYRQVLPGREYFYPPFQTKTNIINTSLEEFFDNLFKIDEIEDKPKKTTLASKLIDKAIGIGPVSAREIAFRAGLPSDIELEALDDQDKKSLYNALKSIIDPIKEGSIAPCVFFAKTTPSFAENKNSTAIAAFELHHLEQTCYKEVLPSMSLALENFYNYHKNSPKPLTKKDSLRKLVQGEITKTTKKISAIIADIKEAENADHYRKCADILMNNLYNIPKRADIVTLPDIYDESSDENDSVSEITIELDPAIPVIANAQAYYAKYNKAKRAVEKLEQQLEVARNDVQYLETVDLSLEHSESPTEIKEITDELVSLNYLKIQKHTYQNQKEKFVPLTFKTSDGFTILVGKNNHQNDEITFKHATNDDIWFHTKDIPGSHVILKTDKKQVPDTSLVEAAKIAAYFSKAKDGSNVPVDYTFRKFVRKPNKAKPGFVYYERQTTLYVTPDEEMIKSTKNA